MPRKISLRRLRRLRSPRPVRIRLRTRRLDVFNYEDPSSAFENRSFKERAGLRSPHHFLLGYEVVYRVVGHSWLNVLLMGNGMIAGLEQSKVLPSANLLIGAEIKNSFQVGVGASLSPLKGSEAHTIVAGSFGGGGAPPQ